MRVIAGEVKGHPLKAPRKAGVRPTSDLVRGAIFNIVGPYFSEEERVLDVYAGTGALGIEALSPRRRLGGLYRSGAPMLCRYSGEPAALRAG